MNNSRFTIYVFLLTFLISLLLVLQLLWTFITPVVLALVMVSIFHPVYRFMLRVFRGVKSLAAGLTTLLIVLCVMIPFGFFIASLSQQALSFYEQSRGTNLFGNLFANLSSTHPVIAHLHDLAISIGINVPAEKLAQEITGLVQSFGLFVYDTLTAVASNALLIGVYFLVTMVIVLTLFISGGELKRYFMELMPLARDEKELLMRRFGAIARAVFVGNGIIALGEGVLGGLGMYWFGFEQGLFWGVVIALCAFVPVVGPTLVFIPAFGVLLLDGNITLGFGYLAYNLTYYAIFELLVKPQFIGGQSQMHAALVFLSVLAGVKVFGPLGIFYGPLVVTMFMAMTDIYKQHYRPLLFKIQN